MEFFISFYDFKKEAFGLKQNQMFILDIDCL